MCSYTGRIWLIRPIAFFVSSIEHYFYIIQFE